MSAGFAVAFSEPAVEDLERLFDFLLQAASTRQDLQHAQDTIDDLRQAVQVQLAKTPFVYRKAGSNPCRRELVVPVGATGYVVLYEVLPPSQVLVLAVRHQLEDDYH